MGNKVFKKILGTAFLVKIIPWKRLFLEKNSLEKNSLEIKFLVKKFLGKRFPCYVVSP
jgi:hypothetical protein